MQVVTTGREALWQMFALAAGGDRCLFTTTPAFLKYLGLRDLADLPPLPELEAAGGVKGWAAAG